MEQQQFYVYTLKCRDGKYYIGRTRNLEDRLSRHRAKQVSYTAPRLPVELPLTLNQKPSSSMSSAEANFIKVKTGRPLIHRDLPLGCLEWVCTKALPAGIVNDNQGR
jgi:predicted GIY-YIG superfamily endonuclease